MNAILVFMTVISMLNVSTKQELSLACVDQDTLAMELMALVQVSSLLMKLTDYPKPQ